MVTKRLGTAKDTIVSILQQAVGNTLFSDVIARKAAEKGFPNGNTIRGRLSELTADGTLVRYKGGGRYSTRFSLSTTAGVQ